jgi:hypothetical protein
MEVRMSDSGGDKQTGHRRRADRTNMVPVPFWTTPDARRQLKMIAAEEDTTQQKLIAEALNLLFATRGRDRCA